MLCLLQLWKLLLLLLQQIWVRRMTWRVQNSCIKTRWQCLYVLLNNLLNYTTKNSTSLSLSLFNSEVNCKTKVIKTNFSLPVAASVCASSHKVALQATMLPRAYEGLFLMKCLKLTLWNPVECEYARVFRLVSINWVKRIGISTAGIATHTHDRQDINSSELSSVYWSTIEG